MKRIICALLGMLMLLSLCACESNGNAEPTPGPSATPKPLTELDRWAMHVVQRYNMDYESFTDYWSLICDGYFGEDLTELVETLSACENLKFSLEDYNGQIADKRAQYDKKYGADWHFEFVSCEAEALEERAKEDFAKEVQNLYDRISVLTNEAAQWGDSSWRYFAEDLGCDLETAKSIVALYEAMGEACNEVEVTEASAVTVTLGYGEEQTEYKTWVYKVNGVYVAQEFIDNTLALINLIY